MKEDVKKLIRKCFETLEKAEVLGNLLYEKFLGNKETDIVLLMINSFVAEVKLTVLELQETLGEAES